MARPLIVFKQDVPFLLGSRFQHADAGLEVGSTTGKTSRINHTAARPTRYVRFWYANWYMSGQNETNGPNDVHVRAGIETGGTVTPLRFSGQLERTLAPGEVVATDWERVDIPYAGYPFASRTFRRVTSAGQQVPRGIVGYSGEWTADGDLAHAGSAGSQTGIGQWIYAPIAAEGLGPEGTPSFAILGDSISTGAVDSPDHDWGYIMRALMGRAGAINLAVGGASSTDLPVGGKRWSLAMQLANHVYYAFGQNDMANVKTYAAVRDPMQSRISAAFEAGKRVIVSPPPPRSGQTTAGSDWSVANQTQPNTNFAAGGTWEQLVEYMYTLPTGAYALLDTLSVWQSAPGSHKWHPLRVKDGVHPNALGHMHAKGVGNKLLNDLGI